MATIQPTDSKSFFQTLAGFLGIRTEEDVQSETREAGAEFDQKVQELANQNLPQMYAGSPRTVEPSTWTNITSFTESIFPAFLVLGSFIGGIIASVMTMNPAPALFGILFALYVLHSCMGD